ncbi:uncharacterized protein BDR25DRAFT_384507 [Lindgomyces ingoldianus]|uniref:Uncharacterized protein n=1 Tax=Lindgomyces ingoldianus TaxID=673940 RepID=A0ACB6R888_9PLEO|nr:uncharacterized protein BDR25DRAFT_384507 [Lindgomyces ingoldianus]KAF2475013.1 hypothetical protein BDR25DRAFT_384507 [Lindgomyces ingoldianus]
MPAVCYRSLHVESRHVLSRTANEKRRGRPNAARKPIWEVLEKNIYMDGIFFDNIPLKGAAGAISIDRLMFGIDYLSLPSLRKDGMYADHGVK